MAQPLTIAVMTKPSVRVAARPRTPRTRSGEKEFAVSLTFRWPNGHTMTFVANNTAPATTLHNTILPALSAAFVTDTRGIPRNPTSESF